MAAEQRVVAVGQFLHLPACTAHLVSGRVDDPSGDGGSGRQQNRAHGRRAEPHLKRQGHDHRPDDRDECGEHDGELEERCGARKRGPHQGQECIARRPQRRVGDATADRRPDGDGEHPIQRGRLAANEHPECPGEDERDDDGEREDVVPASSEHEDRTEESGTDERVEGEDQPATRGRGVLEQGPELVCVQSVPLPHSRQRVARKEAQLDAEGGGSPHRLGLARRISPRPLPHQRPKCTRPATPCGVAGP